MTGCILVALALFATAWMLWIVLGVETVRGFSDSVDYLVYADYFRASWSGRKLAYATEYFGTARYPPLYPALLAAVGAGTSSQLPAFLLQAVLWILALASTVFWLAGQTHSRWEGAWLSVPLALSPTLALAIVNPISEVPFIALLCAGFALVARARTPRALLVAAAVVGMIPLLRMISVALVVAFVAWLLRARTFALRTRIVAAAIAALPALAWLAYRHALPGVENYTQSLAAGNVEQAFGGFQGLLLERPGEMFRGMVELLDPAFGTGATVLAAAAIPIVAVGWWIRLRAGALDALFLFAYVGIVYVWPYPAETPRFLLPLIPIFALCAWQAFATVLGRARGSRDPVRSAAAIALACLLVAAPLWAQLGRRALQDSDAQLAPYKRSLAYLLSEDDTFAVATSIAEAQRMAAVRDLRSFVGMECVYTTNPWLLWLHGRVRTRDIPFPLRAGIPPREQLDECRFFLLTSTSSRQRKQPGLYPLREVQDWTRPVFVAYIRLRGDRFPSVVLLERTQNVGADNAEQN